MRLEDMYSSRGNGSYGQQQYGSQPSYAQNLGSGYPGSSVSGVEGGSQTSLSSRHPSSITGAPQETEIGGYRSHLSTTGTHYGSQYGSVYGSTSLTSSQPLTTKGLGSSVLDSRSGYVPTLPDSPKYASGSYLSSSSHAYGQKADDLYSDKLSGYVPLDRRQYGEGSSAYLGRELKNEPAARYADSSSFGRQTDLYDRIDQASLLRGEQLLKIQSLHTSSVDGGVRQADYLTERSSTIHHSDQEAMHYGRRLESDPHGLSVHSTSSYASQHTPSLLGAVPRRNLDDYIYPESSSNPGYGVSLPPGRDYGSGKGIHSAASLDLDYPGGMLARGGGGPRVDDLRKDDRASYLREFELREEERRREDLRARDKERERERERDRERERQKERERQRTRDRERERIIERREKEIEEERDRERKRALETKRDQTPTARATSRDPKERTPVPKAISRDARSSSLRRDAHREASIRRPSPIRPIRRDYVCKVLSSRLVDMERDYLSLDKRYPRLFVPSEFSKVVVNWPKQKLTLSMHTAVSFEHDYIEDGGVDVKNTPIKSLAAETGGTTVWNAKMILMSGLSRTALEDLSSDKLFEDRIPHICNILKFAVLKQDHSFMATGGPWDPTDGMDPSVDQSSLIKTMLRHAKDKLHLDLSNCRHWNPFLEIHYDRVGRDGVSSFKEITVLFVPDLSECLPSFDAWRTQWLAHRRALTERDRLLSQEVKKDVTVRKGSDDAGDVAKDTEKKTSGDPSGAPTTGTKKIVKKIIKRIVKRPVNDGKASGKKDEKSDEKDVPEKVAISENTVPKEESSGTSDKNVVKKVAATPTENKEKGSEIMAGAQTGESSDPGAKANEQTPSKTIVKKKIIKRVAKRKVAEVDNNMDGDSKKDGDNDEEKVDEAGKKTPDSGSMEMKSPAEKIEESASKTVETKQKAGSPDTEKKEGASSSTKKDIKTGEDKKAEKKINSETQSEDKKGDEKKAKEKITEKEIKERSGKEESRIQGKDRKKSEEPPRPGFILQMKRNKDSKLRSLSVSLDSLLDYTDKDIDESSFELSLFAESLYEMLQYQMGTRIIEFLKKLRVYFVRKRNQRKRHHEELSAKKKEEKTQNKRQKTIEHNDKETSVINESVPEKENKEISAKETVANTVVTLGNKKATGDEAATMEVDNQDEEDEEDDEIDDDPEEDLEEDPEEDPEECEEMDDANLEQEETGEELQKNEESSEKTSGTVAEPTAEVATDRKEEKGSIVEKTDSKSAEIKPKSESDKHGKQEERTSDAPKREETVDKELLQAFRFFDRNQTGYVRVEDLRITIHSLGNSLSHREVKELVQSALLESNTGRDDRVLYNKLVRLSL